jgi:hypothetical protein
MAVTADDQERIVRLLSRDLAATLGSGHEELAARNDGRVRQFVDEPDEYVARVVDTQQDIHDLRIYTTWPTCPRHQRHPLWFHDNAWWCERDRIRVADLGDLASSTR